MYIFTNIYKICLHIFSFFISLQMFSLVFRVCISLSPYSFVFLSVLSLWNIKTYLSMKNRHLFVIFVFVVLFYTLLFFMFAFFVSHPLFDCFLYMENPQTLKKCTQHTLFSAYDLICHKVSSWLYILFFYFSHIFFVPMTVYFSVLTTANIFLFLIVYTMVLYNVVILLHILSHTPVTRQTQRKREKRTKNHQKHKQRVIF